MDVVGDDARHGHGVIYSVSISGVEYYIQYTYYIVGIPSIHISCHKF